MREVDRTLDVLRVVVDAADNDQVFEASRDEQFAIRKEAEVARAKEGPAAITERGAKRLLGLFFAPPVALRDAGAGNPDLAYAVVAAGRGRGRRSCE
jgi:hypothetical protein